MSTEPNKKELNTKLDYDKETGQLIWKARGDARFDKQYAGKAAGVYDNGRIRVSYNGKLHYAARLVYIMHNGKIPKGMKVDHINRNKLDDRISNLRLSTDSQNSCNRRGSSLCGLKGVTRHKSGKWLSRITKDHVVHYLGIFETAKAAGLAYDKAAKKLHGKYAHLNFS